ncbi:MAG: chorismate lyase [Thiogranum sp.]|nr:chorismate lyase [Thiogranum sp.]
MPDGLLSWLLDAGSLTDRLRNACNGHFQVRVLSERWQRPRRDESLSLGVRVTTVAWVRQVQLLCDGKPWVYARTVIPATTLTGPQRRLAHLGSRPLGAFLFADPGMRRGPVEIAPLRAGYSMFSEAVRGLERCPAEIWGRRSVFRLGGRPLLVTEVFLPPVITTNPRKHG